MYGVVCLVKKKADMTREEFAAYGIGEHTPLTAQVEGVRAHRSFPFHAGQDGPFGAIAFVSIRDREAAERALASPAFERALADAADFQAIEQTLNSTAGEHIIV